MWTMGIPILISCVPILITCVLILILGIPMQLRCIHVQISFNPHTNPLYPHPQAHRQLQLCPGCLWVTRVSLCSWDRCVTGRALCGGGWTLVMTGTPLMTARSNPALRAWLEPARRAMAERQQVWVTWRGSKLLHKARLRVDLLGGASPEGRRSAGMGISCPPCCNCGAALAAPGGLSPAPGPPPHPEEDPSWHLPAAFLLRTSEHFTTLGEVQ